MVLLFVYWLITFVYLFAAGEVKQQDCTLAAGEPPYMYCATPSTTPTADCHCGYATVWDRNLQGALAYYVFGFLWGSQWIVAMCYLIVACVFVQYYFKGGNYNGLKNKPIITATKKMMWYHTGTAAVGSFFVAILQFIRLIVRFIVAPHEEVVKDSKIIKYVGYYVEYCLWYLQKTIEWLNRNAYIMTAIEGTSFCNVCLERLGAHGEERLRRRRSQHRRRHHARPRQAGRRLGLWYDRLLDARRRDVQLR